MNKLMLMFVVSIGTVVGAMAQTTLPVGVWQNVDDASHSWVISETEIATRYKGKVLDTDTYEILDDNCNENYTPSDKSHKFLLWAYVCYEIVLIDDNTIKLIGTLKMLNPNMEFKKVD